MYGSGAMGKKQSGFSFRRSAQSFQDNVRRAGPAAGASYTLIGAIILLGGIGYGVDQWQRDRALGLVRRPVAGSDRRVLRVGEGRLASMKPVAWMAGASLTSWLVMRATSDGRGDPEVLFGWPARWRRAVGSWVAYERAHRSAPGRLTNVMIAALAVKMVFFGGYFVVMLRGLEPAAGAVRGEFRRLLHRAARDGGDVPAAPVDERSALAEQRARLRLRST